MTTRVAARLAWTMWAIAVALLLAYLAVYATYAARFGQLTVLDLIEDVFSVPVLLAFSTLGALIVGRRPGNLVGWILCAIGFVWVVERSAGAYAIYTLVAEPGALPGGLAAAWLQNWTWAVFSGMLYIFLPLLFPDGRLLSIRWRPIAWLGIGAVALMVLGLAFHTGKLTNLAILDTFDNPLAIDPIGNNFLGDIGGLFGLVAVIGFVLALLSMLAAAVALLVRLRRAVGEQRQQIKWFAYFGCVLAVLFVVQALVRHILNISSPEFEVVYRTANAVALVCLPLATGLAILRYRLYDIDVLINRTLVYGTLTVTFGLVYYASVALLQGLLRLLTGQQSDLAIIASTLAIAALFQPLRRRIQRLIDQRFYRRKYDAVRTLATFGATIRDEVDLSTLIDRLVLVVEDTIQPTKVAIWLGQDARRQ